MKIPRLISHLLLSLVLLGLGLSLSQAEPARKGAVSVELLPESSQIVPGESFTVALQFEIDPTWHIYWINPGSFGYPPKVEWTLPEGFTAGPLQFPYPKSFEGGGGSGYGYEGSATLLVEIQAPASLAEGTEVTLQAAVGWLMCDPATCVPGDVEVSETVTAAKTLGESANADLIAAARKKVPEFKDWPLTGSVEGGNLILTIDHNGALEEPSQPKFFLQDKGVIDITKPIAISNDGQALTVTAAIKKEEVPETLTAVLVLGDAGAVEVSNAPRDQKTTVEAVEPASNATGLGFFGALFGAFFAGLILNVMPCVFPVISLKILGFVEQAGSDRTKILKHGLWFTGGIFVFFFILASIIMFAGSALGWGFQLQNPAVVMALIIVLLLVALNFFGVFEIGLSLTSVGGNLTDSSGYMGSFWSGALAVVLASPCTAPFMGGAISYGLSNPPHVTYLVFGALAFGMALPYLLLSYQPKLLELLPKPGAWMETFKQIMAFPMLAVTIWLFRVLAKQINVDGLSIFFCGVLLVALGAWWYGKFGMPHKAKSTRYFAQYGTLALLILTGVLIHSANGLRLPSPDRDVEAVIASHQQAGKKVFVDFTAEWCITCQANKLAIHSKKVEAAFEEENIEFVEVDWTQQDPEILKILQRYGREGVPLYLLFDEDSGKEPVVLPNLLTEQIILKGIEKVSG